MTRRDAGFSLLEALVALAVLAITLTTLILVFASNYERIAVETARVRALIEAQSLLERVGLDIRNVAQQTDGTFPDGGKWHLSIAPYDDEPEIARLSGLTQISVTVAPRIGGRADVELHTLRRGERLRP